MTSVILRRQLHLLVFFLYYRERCRNHCSNESSPPPRTPLPLRYASPVSFVIRFWWCSQ